MTKKITVREARKILAIGSDDEKEAVKQELQASWLREQNLKRYVQ